MDETKKNHAAYQDGQARRILMLNDNPFTSELVGLMIGLCFECEFDPVQSGELAIRRLLDRRYDLVFLDSHFPDVDYSKLPTDMAATYQTIPKERHFIGGVKVWTAGERLFRLLRSPEVSHLGWATDVGSVPVIFLTGGPSTLNRAIIRTMPPVAILAMPAKSQDIISTVKELLGWAETGE